MKKGTIILLVIAGIVVLLLFGGVGTYNKLIQLNESVDAQWAQMENQLKRRADLIPNLVNTVKGFAEQEKDVLLGVTEARAGIANANTPGEYAEADAQLTAALKQLNVVVESYPELKSNENFLSLQTQLEGTENRIAVARRDYNESVKSYNSKAKTFPTVIFANMLGMGQREYFEVSEADKQTPKVEF